MNFALLLNRGLLSLLRRAQASPSRQPAPTGQPLAGNSTNGSMIQQLTAARIRTARFPITRRGYQPEAVHALLDSLADEILRLHRCLANVYVENDRIKRALKQWQGDHARTCRGPSAYVGTRQEWPVNRS